MTDLTVLAFPGDARWLERLWSSIHALGACRLIVAGTPDEAREILECAQPRLIVVNGDPGVVVDEAIDELLWINSTLQHPATMVVVADAYDPDRALSLFHMGVDDYLGDTEHWGRLPEILGQLLAAGDETHAPAHILPVSNGVRPLRNQAKAPLRWVTAETA